MENKETLEEVALKLYPRLINDPYNPLEDDNKEERDIWINGAKYQQEQDKHKYSDEEVLDLLFSLSVDNPNDITEWFEIHKKK